MSYYQILTYPDDFLRKKAGEVKNIDGALQTVIEKMTDTMYAAPGTGLAATQVGIDQSILVYDLSDIDGERRLHALINPRIIAKEGEVISESEGCLSIPDYRSNVKRAARVLVEGYDRNETPVRFEADGFHAVVLQHEIDHLNGTLFIDRISALKRGLYKKRIQKKLKNKTR